MDGDLPHTPALRGDELRDHIAWAAKDVFLELGFERASMDQVAARARTSKRTLYAYFGSKESLFLAVAELTRGLFLERLGRPGDGDEDPEDAIVLFCARFLEVLLWESAARTCRLGIAEAERLPAAGAAFYDTLFATTHDRLADYLIERCGCVPPKARDTADALMGRVLYPRVLRVLFGVDTPRAELSEGPGPPRDLDLAPIRAAVAELLDELSERRD